MRHFLATPREMIASAWRNRSLIHTSTKREILSRYRGSAMGLLWSLLNPTFMLIVYTFVFSVVFKARWGAEDESKTEFALILFLGLIIFNMFSECINRAPGTIQGNQNYVKKVIYPLEILPWITMGASLFQGSVSFAVWLLAYTIFIGTPHVTIFFLPLILLPFTLMTMGLSWALATLGVYLRDTTQFVGIVTTALMFMSPIFYPVTALPEAYRSLINLNPLTTLIEQTREVLFWGRAPDLFVFIAYLFLTTSIAWLGFALFQKTRKGFSDVL